MKQLVLASNNAKKIKELNALLAPLGIEVIPQGQLGIPEAEEPHPTFVENALAKARHAAQHSGLPALADDSGLCVRALGGAPGVISARYAGEPKSDARNNEKLLADLAGQNDRRAHFAQWLTAKDNHFFARNIINRVFDSSGPEGKVRGTPQQIIENADVRRVYLGEHFRM